MSVHLATSRHLKTALSVRNPMHNGIEARIQSSGFADLKLIGSRVTDQWRFGENESNTILVVLRRQGIGAQRRNIVRIPTCTPSALALSGPLALIWWGLIVPRLSMPSLPLCHPALQFAQKADRKSHGSTVVDHVFVTL